MTSKDEGRTIQAMADHPELDAGADPWADLRAYTSARIALGRAGAGLPTGELLRFGMAHAQARDAVHLPLDVDALVADLKGMDCEPVVVHSAAPDRAAYLLRPDLGRRLHPNDASRLRDMAPASQMDLLIVVADGLSSQATARQAVPLIRAIRAQAPPDWTLGPVVVATQARVALGDDIGGLWKPRLVAMLIGERPGLSSPDSLGIYLTWQPQPGCHDAQRNCISNVRPEGLSYTDAARRMWWLCQEARRLELTGVGLKDRSDSASLASDSLQQIDNGKV